MTAASTAIAARTLTAEEVLAGAGVTHRVVVPPHLLDAAVEGEREVVVRPLVLSDVIRLHRAAGDDGQLASACTVQQALVEPALTLDQVHGLPAGLVEFLLGEINRASGLTMTSDDLRALVQEPVARACLVLAREFGWTPDQVSTLTVGQLLVYLEMAGRGERP